MEESLISEEGSGLDRILAVFANYNDSYEPGYEEGVLNRIETAKKLIFDYAQKKYHEGELKGKIKQTQRIRQHHKDIHSTCYYDDFFKEEVKLLKYRLEDVK